MHLKDLLLTHVKYLIFNHCIVFHSIDIVETGAEVLQANGLNFNPQWNRDGNLHIRVEIKTYIKLEPSKSWPISVQGRLEDLHLYNQADSKKVSSSYI